MGWCSTSGWVVLVVFSVVSMLIAIALLAAGTVLKSYPDILLNRISSNPDVPDNGPLPKTGGNASHLGDVGSAVMLMGSAIVVVSFTACCGACFKCRCLLITFAVFYILMTVGIMAVTILFLDANSVLHTSVRDFLSKETRRQYSYDQNGEFMQMIHLISIKMECCAIVGPDDLDPDWQNNLVNLTSACCKTLSETTCQSNSAAPSPEDIKQTGCYEKILDEVEEYKRGIILCVTFIMSVMIIQAVLAVGIVVDISRSKRKVGPK